MSPYHDYVSRIVQLIEEAKAQPLGTFPDVSRPVVAPNAPKVLIFSPHPDDEVIIGGIALRLLRESGWNVINVAVTQGSNKARRRERWEELQRCCQCIGFGLRQTAPGGLQGVNVNGREQHKEQWSANVDVIAAILSEERPRAILFPHDEDWNSTHIGTHYLVTDALRRLGPGFNCFTLETEFWGAMKTPNLMVEISKRDLGDLITALTFHVGEVKRNPYHLLLPAWMMDNVRRGCEVALGQGGAAPNFTFATLYRLRRWADGEFQPCLVKGRALGAAEPVRQIFDTRSSGQK